jgi:hypothetical protein
MDMTSRVLPQLEWGNYSWHSKAAHLLHPVAHGSMGAQKFLEGGKALFLHMRGVHMHMMSAACCSLLASCAPKRSAHCDRTKHIGTRF